MRLLFLAAARALGLFALARAIKAGELRILCYHGASVRDEHLFRPALFIRPETFAEHMRLLAKQRYPVLPLADAVERLNAGRLPRHATVITIDDGWYGTYKWMRPTLESFGFPATVYVATYYMDKQTQVFNVALRYVLWSARDRSVDLAAISERLTGTYDLAGREARESAAREIELLAGEATSAVERQQLLRTVCEAVGVDWRALEEERVVAYMTAEEARQLLRSGIDVQLHTHRHRFPMESAALIREIEDNRRSLAVVTGEAREHLCYPSGEYARESFPLLQQLGVRTGTTTRLAMNRPGTHPLELSRLLDTDTTPLLKFEAEVAGFLDLCRGGLAPLGLYRRTEPILRGAWAQPLQQQTARTTR